MASEKIVRPYQSGSVTPPQIEYAAGATEADAPIRLRPGLVGRTRTFQGSSSLSSTVYVIRKPTETKSQS